MCRKVWKQMWDAFKLFICMLQLKTQMWKNLPFIYLYFFLLEHYQAVHENYFRTTILPFFLKKLTHCLKIVKKNEQVINVFPFIQNCKLPCTFLFLFFIFNQTLTSWFHFDHIFITWSQFAEKECTKHPRKQFKRNVAKLGEQKTRKWPLLRCKLRKRWPDTLPETRASHTLLKV